MYHVLIVDDHADIRRLLTVTLSNEYTLLEAADGATALDLVRRMHPQVVLLDEMLPGNISGFSILQAIKSDPLTRDIQVAMVSARGQAVDQKVADQLGADAYFIKPFSPVQVKDWVRSHIQPRS
jgi:DNA-binding response OmpR family regulator